MFGAPVAHEDDPERAVRAALAIRQRVAAANEADPGRNLHVRVAVCTGEALIALGARPSEGEAIAAGDVMNTAARLQAAAPVDGVLVDDATFRATSRAVVYKEHPAVRREGQGRACGGARGRRATVRATASISEVRDGPSSSAGRPSAASLSARWRGHAPSGNPSSSRSSASRASVRAASCGSCGRSWMTIRS